MNNDRRQIINKAWKMVKELKEVLIDISESEGEVPGIRVLGESSYGNRMFIDGLMMGVKSLLHTFEKEFENPEN